MKLQFSLATIFVCVAVMAVVLTYCVSKPVVEPAPYSDSPFDKGIFNLYDSARNPTLGEVLLRFCCYAPPSLAATLAIFWGIRRLKSRRHTEPPVR
jgi:hypothetical protein